MITYRLFRLEWNNLNGFLCDLLYIEHGRFEGSLLGFNVSEEFFILWVLFFQIEIKKPWYNA